MTARKWWREAGLYGLLYGVPFLILFPYSRWRPDAEFQASLRTQAVDFTVGSYKKAGPFVGGCVDAYFGSVGRVELPAGRPAALWGGKIRFRNVDFRGLLLTAGTQVRMIWYEGSPTGVELVLAYKESPGAASALLLLNEKSTVEYLDSGLTEGGAGQSGLIRIAGNTMGGASIYLTEDLRLPVSITPCHEQKSGLSAAKGIALANGSAMRFFTDDGESAIFGATNTVDVRNTERKETVLQGQRLEISGMQERSAGLPSQLGVRIKDGIEVNVLGRAGALRIDGKDVRPSPAEFFRANKTLSAWLTTTVLVGSALLTILSRIKLVRLDGKE